MENTRNGTQNNEHNVEEADMTFDEVQPSLYHRRGTVVVMSNHNVQRLIRLLESAHPACTLHDLVYVVMAVKRALRNRRCRACRRSVCVHIFGMAMWLLEKYQSRHYRSSYMNRTHLNFVDTRFSTFDGYLESGDNLKFHEYTRFTIEEFENLHRRLRTRLLHEQYHRHPIEVKHRLAICLRFLGHGRTYRACGHEFKIGKTTATEIVYEVCRAIIAEFRDEVLPPPTRETWAESAAGFDAFWRYPRGVGAIDGKHFRCVAPIRSGSSYYNYKGTFSIVLMIVADSRYRIMLMDCGGKGRHSDSGLFRTSPIKSFLENARQFFPPAAPLDGNGVVDYHILADGGFPQFKWMQRPFQRREAFQDVQKAHFNTCFSSARRVVENVFGIISSRFRVFQAPLHGKPEHVKLLIITACILHNLLAKKLSGDEMKARYPLVEVNLGSPEENSSRTQGRILDDAHVQRQRLVNYFANRDGLC